MMSSTEASNRIDSSAIDRFGQRRCLVLVKCCHFSHSVDDRAMRHWPGRSGGVFGCNAIDSRLLEDWAPLGSSPTKICKYDSDNRTSDVLGFAERRRNVGLHKVEEVA